MSTTIDSRIVEMKFDNADFEKKTKESMLTLKALNKTLDMSESTKSLSALDAATKSFNLDGIVQAAELVQSRFSTMGIIGMTVIQELTKTAMNAASRIFSTVKGLIAQGGLSRAMNIEQAKFQMEGLGIEYKKMASDIDYAVTNTAYSLDAAAQAASQLATSGLDYEKTLFVHQKDQHEITQMGMALRAVSGVAAQTQSDYAMVARYFQDVANAGKVTGSTLTYMTQVLNMPVKQDLANGLMAIADGSYEASEEVQKAVKNLVRNDKIAVEDIEAMAKDGVLSFDMFSTIMFNKYADHAVAANSTITGVLANIKSAFGKIGAELIAPIIQNDGALVKMLDHFRAKVNELKTQLTPFLRFVAQEIITLISLVDKIVQSFNPKKIVFDPGTIRSLHQSFAGILRLVESIAKPMQEAFKEIFPPRTIDTLKSVSDRFNVFVRSLILSNEQTDKFRRTFAGFFAIFDIFGKLVTSVFRGVLKIFQQFGGTVAGSLLDASASFGDFIVNLDKFLTEGKAFEKITDTIARFGQTAFYIFGAIATFVQKAYQSISNFIGSIDTSSFKNVFAPLTSWFSDLSFDTDSFSSVGEFLATAIKTLVEGFGKLLELFTGIGGQIVKAGGKLWEGLKIIFDKIKGVIEDFFDGELGQALRNASLAVVLYQLKNVGIQIRNIIELLTITGSQTGTGIKNPITGFFTAIKSGGLQFKKAMDQIRDTMFSFEKAIDATRFVTIAAAVLVLAFALKTIGSLDAEGLNTGITGITVLFGELLFVVNMFSKIRAGSFATLDVIPGLLIKLSVSIYIMAKALETIASVPTDKLGQSLGVVTALLIELTVVMSKLSQFSGDKIANSTGALIGLSVALLLISASMKIIATMDTGKMITSTIVLIAMITAIKGMISKFAALDIKPSQIMSVAASLILIGVAFFELSLSLALLAVLPADKLIVATLALISIIGTITVMMAAFSALKVNPAQILSIGASLLIIGASLTEFSTALLMLAVLPVEKIVASTLALLSIMVTFAAIAAVIGSTGVGPAVMIAFAGAMLILGVAMIAISSSLIILASALLIFNSVNPSSILKLAGTLLVLSAGVTALSFAIIGAAALAIFAKGLVLVAGALVLFNKVKVTSILKLGAALLVLAVGLTLMSVAIIGALAIKVLADGLTKLTIALLAFQMVKFSTILNALGALVLLSVGGAVASIGLIALGAAFTVLGIGLTTFGIGLAVIGGAFVIFATGLTSLLALGDMLIKTVNDLLTTLANSLGQLIPQFINIAITVILSFIQAITARLPEIISTGVALVVALLEGIGQNAALLVDAAFKLIIDFCNGLGDAIINNTEALIDSISYLVAALITAFLLLLTDGIPTLLEKMKEVMDKGPLKGIKDKIVEGKNTMSKFMNDVKEKITEKIEDFKRAGKNVIDGLISGFKDKVEDAKNAVKGVADNVLGAFKSALGINSPSKEFQDATHWCMEAIVMTFDKYANQAARASANVANKVLDAFEEPMATISDIVTDMIDVDPVIKPVLDLSNVTTGAKQIGSMLNSNRIGVNGEINQNGGTSSSLGTTYNFTQNNYSPAALSRIDIYRQTQNQFAMLKGMSAT